MLADLADKTELLCHMLLPQYDNLYLLPMTLHKLLLEFKVRMQRASTTGYLSQAEINA